MQCQDIQARVVGNQWYKKIKHPYAVARNVFHVRLRVELLTWFQHYFVQEVLLSFSYSPYNYYCYAVDKAANDSLLDSLLLVSKCLPNVVVLKKVCLLADDVHNVLAISI